MSDEHEPGKPWGTAKLGKAAGVSDAYLRRLLADGKLSGYKVGRDWLIPNEVARAFLAERKAR